MKRILITLTALISMTVAANAMSYEQARQQALFLTDKMAYELNLTEEQYEAAYEVNLDYLMGVNTQADLYGVYWQQRNLDLSYILFDWQYQAYLAASYFYRPLYWEAGYWHFGIYARYPYRDYFYFGRPHFWNVYRGGHSWRMNGGRSWYHGRSFGSRDHHNHGMRDRFDRGDYGRGFGNNGHGSRGNGGRGHGNDNMRNGNNGHGPGNNNMQNGNNRNPGFGNGNNRGGSRGNGNVNNGRDFGHQRTTPSMRNNGGDVKPNSADKVQRGTISPSQTPSRTFDRGSRPSGSSVGSGSRSNGSSVGSGSRSNGSSVSTPSRSFSAPSSSSSSHGASSRSFSSSPSRSFSASSGSSSRSSSSFSGGRSSGSSHSGGSFGGSRSSGGHSGGSFGGHSGGGHGGRR